MQQGYDGLFQRSTNRNLNIKKLKHKKITDRTLTTYAAKNVKQLEKS